MRRYELIRSPLRLLLSGLLLTACGGIPETEQAPSEESLGTQESAVCSGLSVSQLNITDLSSYGGEAAGFGNWAVSMFSNAIRLEYYVDGVLLSSDERPGNSGSWYFSARGITCGSHTVVVKGYPMVIDSNNNRTTCWGSPTTTSQTVIQDCPTPSISCARSSTYYISCTGSATGGTGGYTPFWQDTEERHDTGTQYSSGWYQGAWTQSFYCPMKTREYLYNGELTVEFKASDNSGMMSAAPSARTFICAF
jgi:hypothetical protein